MSAPIDLLDSIFFKQILFYQKCVGTDALTLNYRPNLLTVFYFTMDISFIVFLCYTLATFDTITGLKSLTLLGLGLQGFSKCPTTVFNASTIYDMVAFLRSIYMSNRLRLLPAHKILLRWARLMHTVMRLGSVTINVAALFFVPVSIIESIQTNERQPMINIMVPGMNISGDGNWANYVALYSYHLMLMLLGAVGTCASDLLLVMLVVHLIPLATIIEHQLDELNEALNQPAKVLARSNIRWFFRNILLMHKEITQYLNNIAHVYYYVFFVEIYTNALALCLLIVCNMQMQWIAIYPLFVLFLSKMFAYCFLGTIGEMSTDRIYTALIACEWIKLSPDQKHHYLLMLLAAQKPAVLMAGTVPLNLDTFVNMLKTVYSAGMLIIETLS